MKIGIISDTHDQIEKIEKAVKLLNEKRVGLVIHCGDWVSPFSLLPYKNLKCPIKGIFGNNDGDRFRHVAIVKKFNLNIVYEERFMKLTLDKRKCAVFHGDYQEIVDALVGCGQYDTVFHGHTHIRVNKTVGNTLSLNPGSFLDKTAPGVTGASFAIYDTKTNTAKIIRFLK